MATLAERERLAVAGIEKAVRRFLDTEAITAIIKEQHLLDTPEEMFVIAIALQRISDEFEELGQK